MAQGKESACQWRRHKRCVFNPWVRKIPWRRKWQPTPVFLPGKIPWTEESVGVCSMGLQRVEYDLVSRHTHTWKGIHMLAVSIYFSCITVKQILNTNIYLQGFFPEKSWELNMPNNESEPLSIFNLITISEHFETLIYRPGKVLSLQVATFF